jgi:hypothetical protein
MTAVAIATMPRSPVRPLAARSPQHLLQPPGKDRSARVAPLPPGARMLLGALLSLTGTLVTVMGVLSVVAHPGVPAASRALVGLVGTIAVLHCTTTGWRDR